MPDTTYQPKTYRKAGGDEMVIASGGKLTVEPGGIVTGIAPGNLWFVDGTSGLDTNGGTAFGSAYLTIAAAVAAASAGDTIFLKGTFNESVTAAKIGLAFIGIGTGPHQATWNPAAGNDKVNLAITANDVLVSNIKFRPGPQSATYSACITLAGASYSRILGNRFQGTAGAYYAIYSPAADSDNVLVSGNEFLYFNTATYGAAILGVEAGGLNYSDWRIADNVFSSCVTAINIGARVTTITGNTIAEYGINAAGAVAAVLALGIDLSGTNSGANQVWNNQLGGTYNATLYKVGAAGDQWGGNLNVIAGGVTAANPA